MISVVPTAARLYRWRMGSSDRWASVATLVVAVIGGGCRRDTGPRVGAAVRALEIASARSPPQPPAPASVVDAGPAPVTVTDATCDDGDRLAPLLRGIEAGAQVSCVLSDGGIAFTIPAGPPRRSFALLMVHAIQRQVDAVGSGGWSREIARMEAEAHTDVRHWAAPGLVLRAPERTRGKFVRLDGVAEEVREEGGATRLAIDMLGHERFEVELPRLAPDDVVSGARVRAYGIYYDATTRTTALGSGPVPRIMAVAVVATR